MEEDSRAAKRLSREVSEPESSRATSASASICSTLSLMRLNASRAPVDDDLDIMSLILVDTLAVCARALSWSFFILASEIFCSSCCICAKRFCTACSCDSS